MVAGIDSPPCRVRAAGAARPWLNCAYGNGERITIGAVAGVRVGCRCRIRQAASRDLAVWQMREGTSPIFNLLFGPYSLQHTLNKNECGKYYALYGIANDYGYSCIQLTGYSCMCIAIAYRL